MRRRENEGKTRQRLFVRSRRRHCRGLTSVCWSWRWVGARAPTAGGRPVEGAARPRRRHARARRVARCERHRETRDAGAGARSLRRVGARRQPLPIMDRIARDRSRNRGMRTHQSCGPGPSWPRALRVREEAGRRGKRSAFGSRVRCVRTRRSRPRASRGSRAANAKVARRRDT